ncbi:MAG: threonine synthase [Clostridia bacterium]|nr:threonine synthase [Clostridia bacterium]
MLHYLSTRGGTAANTRIRSAEAILRGLAPDGGLFMPERIPALTRDDLKKLCGQTYPERASFLLSRFLDDYPVSELEAYARDAYGEDRFPGGAAPLHNLDGRRSVLELWHGPTCAFKDMALQMMPKLLSGSLRLTGEARTAVILVATSGDTGKAALEGFRDVPQVRILVFYPEDGVSRMQKLQMATQEGGNVGVLAISGNFDDAQTGVKSIFSDPGTADALERAGCFFSSANSINWGRLAPQIVYYVSAYCDLVTKGSIRLGDEIVFSVPTGNFGNIFAGYLAKRMGVPIRRFLCASNRNHILTDFLKTGVYDRNRPFHTTMSPSMDILISSNLERLLYTVTGSGLTSGWMTQLKENGVYRVPDAVRSSIRESFLGYYCDEAQTISAIRNTYEQFGYLIDPHTAVAVHAANRYREETGDPVPTVILSTASPYKFAGAVLSALSGSVPEDEFEALSALSHMTGTEIPAQLASLREKPVRFRTVLSPDEMTGATLSFVKTLCPSLS